MDFELHLRSHFSDRSAGEYFTCISRHHAFGNHGSTRRREASNPSRCAKWTERLESTVDLECRPLLDHEPMSEKARKSSSYDQAGLFISLQLLRRQSSMHDGTPLAGGGGRHPMKSFACLRMLKGVTPQYNLIFPGIWNHDGRGSTYVE
jgi:hypothetical protein